MGPKTLLRLGSGGSRRRRSEAQNMRPSYPHQIEVKADGGFETKLLHQEEELAFWKTKALELKDALTGFETKVAELEEEVATLRGGGGSAPASPSASDVDAATPPSSTSTKKQDADEGHWERKDEIVKQLVSEMEKLMHQHVGDGSIHGMDAGCDGSNGGSSDATTTSARSTTIKTSTLELLVSRALSAEKDEGPTPSAETTSTKPPSSSVPKKRQKKKYDMYQLSCRNCIGCNYVGAVKKDKLKERVRHNYKLVWQVCQTAYGKGDGTAAAADHREHRDLPFLASSFAHHVADHCKSCESEEEVYWWCVVNVRCERISKHLM